MPIHATNRSLAAMDAGSGSAVVVTLALAAPAFRAATLGSVTSYFQALMVMVNDVRLTGCPELMVSPPEMAP